ncbi:MAG: molybdopterin-synthase adenylyltransferase MoeB [Bacteroidetes bacterium]|nr:molybdopterin-synthase adenylyltransferase MoeB [Bacteroidota bacterium]
MKEITLNPAEMARYARHISIPEFNIEGQKKMKAARVIVIGAGGLGSPLLLYLAAAGVGHLGIVDYDVVDESNLQRQILFSVEDLGKPKAEVAKKRLLALNPHIDITVYKTKITRENALDLISQYNVVADGSDNFPTRYLVNDASVLAGKVNVYASIFRFEGQVSVFNFLNKNGTRGPNYRDMFPEPPPPNLVPSCAEGGVLGVLPGIIGSMQASEVIKVITGIGEPLSGKLFLFDAVSFMTRILKIQKKESYQIKELINYEQFCGMEWFSLGNKVKEVDVHQLNNMIKSGEDFQLIDVRKPYEYEIANLKGDLIPMSAIMESIAQIKRDRKVIIHCRSGVRSANAIKELQKLHGFDNLYNLKGGILAWANELDDKMQTY